MNIGKGILEYKGEEGRIGKKGRRGDGKEEEENRRGRMTGKEDRGV
jgi:hypothetical protein